MDGGHATMESPIPTAPTPCRPSPQPWRTDQLESCGPQGVPPILHDGISPDSRIALNRQSPRRRPHKDRYQRQFHTPDPLDPLDSPPSSDPPDLPPSPWDLLGGILEEAPFNYDINDESMTKQPYQPSHFRYRSVSPRPASPGAGSSIHSKTVQPLWRPRVSDSILTAASSDSSNVKDRKQLSTHERPFKCDQCPQSFNRNHDLKRHKRIHLAVKPFPCAHCDKSFSRKDALKRHILVKGCGKTAQTNEAKVERDDCRPKPTYSLDSAISSTTESTESTGQLKLAVTGPSDERKRGSRLALAEAQDSQPARFQVAFTGASESIADGEMDWWSEDSSPESYATAISSNLAIYAGRTAFALFALFSRWREHGNKRSQNGKGQLQNTEAAGSSCLNTNSSSHAVSSQTAGGFKMPSRKKPSDDEDEQRPTKRQRWKPSAEGTKAQFLACPFAKNNPLRHSKCYKYMIQEISRLKQHLLRTHQVPIHCARCRTVFSTEDARDDHQRQASECTIQPSQAWDGVSETQRRQLARRVSSKKTREENWYLIYQILFPGAPQPESPYIDDRQLSEELLAFRDFTRQEAPALISAFARSEIPSELRTTQAVEEFALVAFRGVFEMVIEQWSDRDVLQQASSSTDSGYGTAERDASTYSSPPQSLVDQQTPARGIEDGGETPMSVGANFGTEPSTGTNFAEEFSVDTVVWNVLGNLPDDGSAFEFLNGLEP